METIPTLAGTLTLVCCKCSRYEEFRCNHRQEANEAALKKGWKLLPNGKMVCKRCPK